MIHDHCVSLVFRILDRHHSLLARVADLQRELSGFRVQAKEDATMLAELLEQLADLASVAAISSVEEEELRISFQSSSRDGLSQWLARTSGKRRTLELMQAAIARSSVAAATGERTAATAGAKLGEAFTDALLESLQAENAALLEFLNRELSFEPRAPAGSKLNSALA